MRALFRLAFPVTMALLAPPLLATEVVSSPTLPIRLDHGWEASDGDPVGGPTGLDRMSWRPADPIREQAPRGSVRWYRVALDLSAHRGKGLAFASPGIRDADEAYFETERIGGQGSFPPKLDHANLVFRLYPIPSTLFDEAGPHRLYVRVWHGTRSGTVFRYPPIVDDRETLYMARSRTDQALVFFFGITLAVAVVCVLFAVHAEGAAEYPIFALLSLFLGVYAMTLHSGWGVWPVSRELPFRLGSFAALTLAACYVAGLSRLLHAEAPRRYLIYYVWLLAGAVAALVVPNTEVLVVPTRIDSFVVILALLDLMLPIGRALAERRRRAVAVALGHATFLLGVLVLADVVRPGAFFGPRPAVVLLGGGYAILTVTFLWAMSDQLSRFRVAALTDPATRLWNRSALFAELEQRAEAARRGSARTLGLILIDLDRFKQWNDVKGHLAGDRLLVRVARALQDTSRPGDLVSRYGGDEFAVVVEEVDDLSARAAAERLRGAVDLAIQNEAGGCPVTASLGVALFSPTRHTTVTALFQDADRALYDAKEAGRDRVVLFAPRASSGSRKRPSGVMAPLKRPSGTVAKKE